MLEIGEDGGQIARPLDGGAGGGANAHPHLARDDVGERGLTQARRAVEEDMVQGLDTLLGGSDGAAQVVLHLLLADVVGEMARPQRRLEGLFFVSRCSGQDALSSHGAPSAADHCTSIVPSNLLRSASGDHNPDDQRSRGTTMWL